MVSSLVPVDEALEVIIPTTYARTEGERQVGIQAPRVPDVVLAYNLPINV